MAQEIFTFAGDALPSEFKWQILSFMRVQWFHGFQGKLRLRDWITPSAHHPLHFLITENSFVISQCEVVWKYLDHAGETYKVYGLSGVFTFPDHQRQGYGKQVVDRATRYIDASDGDVAMLWCDPHNRPFYLRCGWKFIESARTLFTADDGTVVEEAESLMMLFISEKGRQSETAFWNEPIQFGDGLW